MRQRRRMLRGETRPRAVDARDERKKLTGRCAYCGERATGIDHLIPRLADGPDSADNLVPACRSCNSSKGAQDVCVWARRHGFLPLDVLRRYLVLAWNWTERAGLLDAPTDALRAAEPPFTIGEIPWEHLEIPWEHLGKTVRTRPARGSNSA